MNAVGIDVSKGKSMVTILRPFGEIETRPFILEFSGFYILFNLQLLRFVVVNFFSSSSDILS